jgi:ribosomal-protein-alanine acetyltransferase
MQVTDLPQVLEIENLLFSDAWIEELFEMELSHDAYVAVLEDAVEQDADPAETAIQLQSVHQQDRHSALLTGLPVAGRSARIAGYICAWQVMDECTITNIAVHSDAQRRGIAGWMFAELTRIMDARQVKYYYLEVRDSNFGAQALYEKLGFRRVGLRKNYYHNPVEDAVVMALEKNERI